MGGGGGGEGEGDNDDDDDNDNDESKKPPGQVKIKQFHHDPNRRNILSADVAGRLGRVLGDGRTGEEVRRRSLGLLALAHLEGGEVKLAKAAVERVRKIDKNYRGGRRGNKRSDGDGAGFGGDDYLVVVRALNNEVESRDFGGMLGVQRTYTTAVVASATVKNVLLKRKVLTSQQKPMDNEASYLKLAKVFNLHR